MKVELIEPLNSDNGICDAARVSFDKRAEDYGDAKNASIISYMAKHKHWSPFGHSREMYDLIMPQKEIFQFLLRANLAGFAWAYDEAKHRFRLNGSLWAWHENLAYLPPAIRIEIAHDLLARYPVAGPILLAQYLVHDYDESLRTYTSHREPVNVPLEHAHLYFVSFRFTTPIFVARQLVKHQQQLCWNEVSRRYVDAPPKVFIPDTWRARPESNVKQGSGGALLGALQLEAQDLYNRLTAAALSGYYLMIKVLRVAPEQARMALPLSMETSWIWTGSLSAWARVCAERLAPNAQQETREAVEGLNELLFQNHMQRWELARAQQPTG